MACIDPGPDDDPHLRALTEAIGLIGRLTVILVSHSHPDHRPLARRLAATHDVAIRCLDVDREADGAVPIRDGDIVRVGQGALVAVATPGHTADHLCFHDPDAGTLYSGDHILGGSTSVVAPPDGDMTAYMASLERVRLLRPVSIHPGHGETIDDGVGLIDAYVAHRLERERVILAAIGHGGPVRPIDLVPTIYAAYDPQLWPLAARSVEAHLDKLVRDGRAVRTPPVAPDDPPTYVAV